ncbi:MAG: SDR family oxidoreductase [Phycisphaerae bacterium]|nr:SDR family oxidoreductase [Phycisphaerae bacterium]
MNKRLAEKVAVVTGASRGIGRAIAVALGGEGASVVLAARDIEALNDTAKLVSQAGGKAMVVPTEMTDEGSLINLIRSAGDRFGRIDILINNAGVTHSAKLTETTTADYDRCMAVNARAPYILCREVIPWLGNLGRGYIINIASVVGVKGYSLQTAYGASKHALRGMSIALAEELKNENIRVHVICPGGVDTEMVTRVRPDIKKDDLIAPQEIAELVLYLVTHRGNAVMDEIHLRRQTSGPWF